MPLLNGEHSTAARGKALMEDEPPRVPLQGEVPRTSILQQTTTWVPNRREVPQPVPQQGETTKAYANNATQTGDLFDHLKQKIAKRS